jgi:predicted enzyme related to lactoylglutathione lyase
MSKGPEAKVGTLAWLDLTVRDAETVRDFYKDVVGWDSQDVSMGGYSDFSMVAPSTGDSVAGICHTRGSNANLPSQWLFYVIVEDLDRSMTRCAELGGEVIDGPRSLGQGRFCVIRDPAGAMCALCQP